MGLLWDVGAKQTTLLCPDPFYITGFEEEGEIFAARALREKNSAHAAEVPVTGGPASTPWGIALPIADL